MSEKRYVQYRNDPNGTKWEVVPSEREEFWECKQQHHSSFYIRLPKSDYILCAPPERWTDVTAEFHHTENWPSVRHSKSNALANIRGYVLWAPTEHGGGYRLRKVQLYKCEPSSPQNCEQWAFIVEKRED